MGFAVSHLLIIILAVLLPLSIFLWLRRNSSSSSKSSYRSLRVASPVLNFFIIMAMIGKPILEYFKEHQSQADAINPAFFLPVVFFFLVCIYAAVGASIYFYYRAIENINFFAGARMRAPGTSLLMVVPVVNLLAMPYVLYFTYYRSMALLPAHHVSKIRAVALAIGTFVLLVASIAFGLASGNDAIRSDDFDSVSLSLVATCAGLAAGILYTRIVSRVFKAQEAYATYIGAVLHSDASNEAVRSGALDALRSIAVALLVGSGIFTLFSPTQASYWVASVVQTVRVKVAEPANSSPTPDEHLHAMAAELTKSGRQQLDQITWLEGATAEAGRFIYQYSVSAERQPAENATHFLNQIRPNIVRGYCTDPSFQVFRDLNAAVVYRYANADRSPLGEVVVSNADCAS